MFGGGYVEQEAPKVDKDQPKITYGSNADWKTQAALAKPGNKPVVAYNLRQKELESK